MSGKVDPARAEDVGAARALRALIARDIVFDDVLNVIIEFERSGIDPYVVSVLIDNNLGGVAKGIVVGPPLAELRAAAELPVEAAGTGELRLEEIGLGEAAARCREALRRTGQALDPPVDEDFERRVAEVVAHLRVLPDDGGAYEAREVAERDRRAALDGFLASPEAEPFRDRDDAVDFATVAIDYGADHVEGEGRPLRWSPAVVELFLTWFLPRTVVREPEFFERTVPELLPAWVRYAGRARGIPGEAVDEAEGAVAELVDEMLVLARDESAWGPAKAVTMTAERVGVDLIDEASLDTLLGKRRPGLAA